MSKSSDSKKLRPNKSHDDAPGKGITLEAISWTVSL